MATPATGSAVTVPATLLFEQGTMLSTLARIAFRAMRPDSWPAENPPQWPVVERILPPPSQRLVNHYCRWCGADPARYADDLPPHLFTQFALPVTAEQLKLSRYPLHKVINRGCSVKVFHQIPRHVAIIVRSEVIEVNDDGQRASLRFRLTIGSMEQPKAVEAEIETLFLLTKPDKKKKSSVTDSTAAPNYRSAGQWRAASNDGWQFGLLTGDLNPIHWLTPLAEKSPFKGKVLHGFGSFVRSYEQLQNHHQQAIREMSVRFNRPVPLPSDALTVEYIAAPSAAECQFRLTDKEGTALLSGHYCLL
ncbi:hypothetical protein DU002_08395 [Corallincola holothuriorum]|uniref:MaoC-like domain-containing protein n=1 Tax=Corallincola holothuriorum TaxID=2282215 RepID=A0A368NKN9_9GAMM|nr:MaoC/PaaZ C-terminal domain-containing protein [Corallincola holothuriorum]RCU50433.1 hypothetical protein DU002_08395 [Corallincola holothuriorum]